MASRVNSPSSEPQKLSAEEKKWAKLAQRLGVAPGTGKTPGRTPAQLRDALFQSAFEDGPSKKR